MNQLMLFLLSLTLVAVAYVARTAENEAPNLAIAALSVQSSANLSVQSPANLSALGPTSCSDSFLSTSTSAASSCRSGR